MGSQTTELEEAAQLYLAVLSRRNHQHLQILHVKLLTRRPVAVLGSLSAKKKHPRLAMAANEFFLGGKH